METMGVHQMHANSRSFKRVALSHQYIISTTMSESFLDRLVVDNGVHSQAISSSHSPESQINFRESSWMVQCL